MSLINDPNITALDTAATQAENSAAQYTSASMTLPDQLRQAVAERFQSSPLIGQRDAALSTYLDTSGKNRTDMAALVKGGTILSPTQQATISGARTTSATIPLISINDLLQSQFGTVGDIVTAESNAFNAKAGLAQTQATQARSTANTAFDRLLKDKQYQLEAAKVAQTSGNKNNALLLAKLLGLTGDTGTTSQGGTEPMPTTTPSDSLLSTVTGTINSPAGEWTWDKATNAWKSNMTVSSSSSDTGSDTQKRQAISLALLGGAIQPAQANALTAMLQLNKKPPTAQQIKDAINARSGLNAISTVEAMIAKDPTIVARSQTPLLGRFGEGGKFRYALSEASDVKGRLRTGAAINKDEMALYNFMLPLLTDSPDTILYKLSSLKNLYSSFVDSGSPSPASTTTPYGTNADWEVVAP